ncbi:response regulator [Larkinella sp. C7]|jgi:DNA-binding NtrC family response regulator|uniref:response regulator n=1 Tax=Larkinella sp. C7 TaxID=2576607 RepID=UPI001111173B|nr:response regulator [Larkinella sp. C7]
MAPFYLLIADDQIDIGKLLQLTVRMVYKDQVHLRIALTVPDLKDCMASTKYRPDVLLLDYHLRPLPEKAPNVLRWMQSQDHLQGLPVVVWSSLPDGPEADQCRQLGAQRFVTKMDAMSDMVQFVKSLVEDRVSNESF